MKKPLILVTGATGKTGGAVVQQLLREGLPVRAVVRTLDARAQSLQRQGAEIAVASMYDPQQLLEALRGTQRAYYLTLFQPYMIQAAAAFCVAAREARIESVVQMSQWTSNPSHPSLLTRQTWLVDRLFAAIPGVGHTILNPGMFADNFLRMMDFAALLGVFPVLAGRSRSAPVSNEDIARVAAKVLADPSPHHAKRYRPTGPRLLSGHDMAEVIERTLGRRVRAFDLPFWMLLKVARRQGIDPFELSSLRDYMEDHRRGVFEFEGGVNDTVRELTGTPAEDFEVTVRRYAAMPFARRTPARRLRAMADFLLTPFLPGYNLAAYERALRAPTPDAPLFSADSALWRREHSLNPQPAP